MQARSMKIITLEFPGEPGVLGVHCGRWLPVGGCKGDDLCDLCEDGGHHEQGGVWPPSKNRSHQDVENNDH